MKAPLQASTCSPHGLLTGSCESLLPTHSVQAPTLVPPPPILFKAACQGRRVGSGLTVAVNRRPFAVTTAVSGHLTPASLEVCP